jgi:hypothetical protein
MIAHANTAILRSVLSHGSDAEQSLNARCSELVLMRVYFTHQQQIKKKKKGAKFLDRACVRCGCAIQVADGKGGSRHRGGGGSSRRRWRRRRPAACARHPAGSCGATAVGAAAAAVAATTAGGASSNEFARGCTSTGTFLASPSGQTESPGRPLPALWPPYQWLALHTFIRPATVASIN